MRRLLLLTALIATAALAAAPSPATAKGVRDAEVCGAAGCREADRDAYFAFLPDARESDPPTAAAPFVTVTVTMEHDRSETGSFTYDYVPSLGMMRTDDMSTYGEWMTLTHAARVTLDDVIAGTKLKPAVQLGELPPPSATTPTPSPAADGTPWWAIAGAGVAILALLALLARYATSALKARPRASKSVN